MVPSIPQLPRQRQAAEEHFLEQTPWANPQHPIHSQILNNAQRQVSGHLSPNIPFTPLGQKRIVDGPIIDGSGSTIPVFPSSSLAPTPMSTDISPVNHQKPPPSLAKENHMDTPSRPPPLIDRDDATATKHPIGSEGNVTKKSGTASNRTATHSSPPNKSRLSSNLDNASHSTKPPQRHQATQGLDEAVTSPRNARLQAQFTPQNNLQAGVKVGNA